jgi:hypothetical protein
MIFLKLSWWYIFDNVNITNNLYVTDNVNIKVKIKKYRYRPGVAMRVPGS